MRRSPSSVPASPEPLDPAEALRAAVGCEQPAEQRRLALAGLRALDEAPGGGDPELRALLWRQVHRAWLEEGDLEQALAAARHAAGPGCPVPEVAYTDLARVLMALGREQEAIETQRLAARAAPPDRRGFHLWTLGALLQAAGQWDEAERTLRRALRWARRERELLQAHLLWLDLQRGRHPGHDELRRAADALARAPSRGGYGELLQGILRAHAEQRDEARALLGRFVERMRKGPTARRLTLQFELREAERLLATLADA